jgi:monothiol glutaredoxin
MTEKTITEQIQNLIDQNKVILFMKGNKEQPMCGFSSQVIQILNDYGVPYETVNVLDNWDLRENLKTFSNWPTIPQLYINQKFVGGCDITMALHRSGDLKTLLGV